MKKIFTLFLLCIFSLNTLPTFAENVAPMVDPNTGSLDKAPIAPATKKLNDNSKWKNYIQIVDNFVEKTNSEETLNKILERTNAVIAWVLCRISKLHKSKSKSKIRNFEIFW